MSLTSKLAYDDPSIDYAGKRVLIRVDFNVPLDSKENKLGKKVTNDQRIVGALDTVKYVLQKKPKAVILMSHLGRPDGQPKYIKETKGADGKKQREVTGEPNKGDSLENVLQVLKERLAEKMSPEKVDVVFARDCVGKEAQEVVGKASNGQVVLLENLRFHIEEEGKGVDDKAESVKADKAKIEEFRKELTSFGDIYINDAFGTAHRAHSSMVGIDLPQKAAGALMKNELREFGTVLENPKRKFMAILGGAKVKDKIQLIDNLLDKVNVLIIGGGMAFTFKSKIENIKIGNSIYDEEGAGKVEGIMKKAKDKNVQIILPNDYTTGTEFSENSKVDTATDEKGIPDGWTGFDVGPRSNKMFADAILDKDVKTILWNGPPGVFELKPFAKGTEEMAEAIKKAQAGGTQVVVGGGDTATAAVKFGCEGKLSHISTGGGASLELLEGKDLPGVAALSQK